MTEYCDPNTPLCGINFCYNPESCEAREKYHEIQSLKKAFLKCEEAWGNNRRNSQTIPKNFKFGGKN